MNFRRLAIWTLVFMTSGLVCLLNPEEGYGIENPKRWRESREILKILKFQKDLKKKYPETFPKGRGKNQSELSKIRLRFLTGSISSGTTSVSNSTNTLIWNGWGIGQSVLKYKTSKSNITYDLENTFSDLSYTFGNEWTFSLGLGSVSSGKGTITTSSRRYLSSKVSGSGYFGVFGIEVGIFELLLGLRNNKVEYTKFHIDSAGTMVSLNTKYKVSGGQLMFGIGLSF